MISIYTLSDPRGNKIRYVGQTVRPLSKRLASHICDSKALKNRKHCWVKSIIDAGSKPLINLIGYACCQSCANHLETLYISYFNSLGNDLVNLASGGREGFEFSNDIKSIMSSKKLKFWSNESNKRAILDSMKEGKKKDAERLLILGQDHARKYFHSPESRAKAAVTRKATINTDAYKKTKSDFFKSWWENISEEERNKKIHAFTQSGRNKLKETGFFKSEKNIEHILKLASAQREQKSKPFNGFKNGENIGSWSNLIDAEKELNVCYQNIRAVLIGKAKTAKGYTFAYFS